MHVDSIDKIVNSYFAAVTAAPFSYRGRQFVPKPLTVSTMIFRGFTCPAKCGGCCPKFSLDYLPGEAPPYPLTPRILEFDGRLVTILSDLQADHRNHHCRNLDMESGRCNIYESRPFSCDFELIRAFHSDDNVRLSQQLFGRGHQLLRVDGERGARCEMLPVSAHSVNEVVRKLKRLKQWAEYFGLSHRVSRIIDWCQDRSPTPSSEPLRFTCEETAHA